MFRETGTGMVGLFERFKSKFYLDDDAPIKSEIPLIKFDGTCILCGISKPNSEDHFPLKAMGNDGKWFYRNFHNFRLNVPEHKIGLCQNGVSYRTICAKCNSILGSAFDPSLLDLYQQFKKATGLCRIGYSGRKLLQCLAGHFLAAALFDESSNPRSMELLQVYNTGNPNGYRMFVGPYGGRHAAVLREMAVYNLETRKSSFFYVMKIAPIALILTKEIPRDPHFTELKLDLDLVRIDLDRKVHPFYPELTELSDDPPQLQILGESISHSIIAVRELWHPRKGGKRKGTNFKAEVTGEYQGEHGSGDQG